jgi:hypothetical protein
MAHTYRLKAGDNPGAAQYEVGYAANDPNAADPRAFTVTDIVPDQKSAAQTSVKKTKDNPGLGHP